MSRSVTFNGITQYRPGGMTKLDANALAQIGLSPNGIVGIIGEAEGGKPNVITTMDDPALAVPSFTSGDLADAIRIAFDPSGDTRVPAGAFRVLAIKTNQSTQSTLIMYGIVPPIVGGRPFDTAAAGSTTTVINLTTAGLTIDAHIGNILRIGTEERPITDNAAGTVTVSPAFSAAPVVGTPVYFLAPQFTYTSRDYGLKCNRIKQEVESGGTQGVVWTSSLDSNSQTSEDICGRSYLDLEYVGQSAQVVLDTGTTDGAGSSSIIQDSTKSWGSNAFQYYFVYVSGGALAVPNLRKIASNTANAITTALTFKNGGVDVAPGIGATYAVRRSTIRTGTLVSATSTTVTLEATLNLAPYEFANLVIAITGGKGSGQRRVIAANTAGISSVLTMVEPFATTPDATSTYAIRYVTQAVGTMVGSAGVTTGFQTLVTKDGGTPATELNVTFTKGQTIQDLVNTINANADYVAYVPNGINPLALINDYDYDNGSYKVELRTDRSTFATSPFPVFVYSPTTGVGDVLDVAGGLVTLTDLGASFTSDMVGRLIQISGCSNGGNNGFFQIIGVGSGTTLFFLNSSGVTETVALAWSISSPISMKWANHFRKDLVDLLNDMNNKSQYASVARAVGISFGAGTGLPEFTGSGLGSKAQVGDYFKYMAGAVRGTSSNTNWQAAFDELLKVRCMHVIPCISEDLSGQGYSSTATFASVMAQLVSHVAQASCRLSRRFGA
jgi:hypothetical protein